MRWRNDVRKLIPVVILLLFSACQKAEVSSARFATTTNAQAPATKDAGRTIMPEGSLAATVGAQAPVKNEAARMIVRTADVRITVVDTSKTVEAVTKFVEAAGGYVSASQIWRDGELLRARVTLRLPAARLTESLAAIRGLAKRVDNETIASTEVSEEFVDLESRVRNLEATETELLELLKVARVNSRKATDVLEVHRQVTTIRGEIEQAKGRMRYLSQMADMSTIALEVVPDAIAQPVVEPGWRPLVIARDASRALVGVLQAAGTAAIWLVIYILPILGMLALIAAFAWRARRLLRT